MFKGFSTVFNAFQWFFDSLKCFSTVFKGFKAFSIAEGRGRHRGMGVGGRDRGQGAMLRARGGYLGEAPSAGVSPIGSDPLLAGVPQLPTEAQTGLSALHAWKGNCHRPESPLHVCGKRLPWAE